MRRTITTMTMITVLSERATTPIPDEHQPHRHHQEVAASSAPEPLSQQGDLLGSWMQGWAWCPSWLLQQPSIWTLAGFLASCSSILPMASSWPWWWRSTGCPRRSLHHHLLPSPPASAGLPLLEPDRVRLGFFLGVSFSLFTSCHSA